MYTYNVHAKDIPALIQKYSLHSWQFEYVGEGNIIVFTVFNFIHQFESDLNIIDFTYIWI